MHNIQLYHNAPACAPQGIVKISQIIIVNTLYLIVHFTCNFSGPGLITCNFLVEGQQPREKVVQRNQGIT